MHFAHARNPVGRYQRENGNSHVEIRSVGEWFDADSDVRHWPFLAQLDESQVCRWSTAEASQSMACIAVTTSRLALKCVGVLSR
ncbi:hypothetical protein ACSCB1_00415 [Streptomyces europaeiscabiei]|uniref:hypothetical protein n=1 Tax=Streptomyces europaeiscabiei TaxID=146819 RepID=UPI00062861B9|nr:hypothetical protein [Streptomyces europaeiscabiei]